MFKHCINMKIEQVQEVRKWGNSGGVLLPREWLGKQARIVLIDRTLEVRKEVLAILEPYFEDIMGIYLVGSYARGDQKKDSDIDILVISNETRKSLKSGKYEIEIIPLRVAVRLIADYPAMIYPKIVDASVILNAGLLDQIRKTKITRKSMRNYLDDCRRIIKTDRVFIARDKSEGDTLEANSVVYSSILRLRALYIMNSIFSRKKHSNKLFEEGIILKLGIDREAYDRIYKIYKAIRDDNKIKDKISIELAEKLVDLLDKEATLMSKDGKKKKEA